MIGSKTNVYAIIGNPIEHSLSPRLHNAMFQKYNIDAVYVAFKTNNLKNAIEGVRSLGINGINVTVPFKSEVTKFIDVIDEEAKIIGSLNTIKSVESALHGFNTDYLGFLETIKDIDCNKNICILGAGGAACAIIYGFYKKGIKSLNIYNRTFDGAFKLKERFSDFIKLNIIDKKEIYKNDILVNCTSLGINQTDDFPLDLLLIRKDSLLIDIIYNSLLTEKALQSGINAINGNKMFIYQAYYAFEIWTNIKFDIDFGFEVINGFHK